MAIEIKIPDIGTDEVEVTEMLVNVGDTVTVEQSLLTVEGDKASMEIPSPQAGVIKEIKVVVGDKVTTGTLMMTFSPVGETAAQPLAEPAPKLEETAPGAASQQKLVVVPDIGSDEVEVTEILVKIGDMVNAEQSLITVEGDKASMEIPSPFAGVVHTITVAVGDKVKTDSPMMMFTLEGAAPVSLIQENASQPTPIVSPSAKAKDSVPTPTDISVSSSEFVTNQAYAHATPLVRRLAREFGVNLGQIKGSGRKGRILREDVQNYVKEMLKRLSTTAAVATNGALSSLLPWPKVDFSKFGEIEEIELGKIKKISGANLHRNWVMIPHITQFDETDITELEAFRKQQNIEAEQQKLEVKITPLVFVMKAVAKALEAMPQFNSSLLPDAHRLILKKYINIGVAVDTPNGLVVPVFRDVNKKGIIELSRELADISKKARMGKLTTIDMQGGCFTISSLGGIGGTAFTPIVNAPEVAILGVSKSTMKPIWNGKEFVPRLMLPLSLSYDHRVIDGADGARFISYINKIMSDIRRLVM